MEVNAYFGKSKSKLIETIYYDEILFIQVSLVK